MRLPRILIAQAMGTAISLLALCAPSSALVIEEPGYYTTKVGYNCLNDTGNPFQYPYNAVNMTSIELTNNSSNSLAFTVQAIDNYYGNMELMTITIAAGSSYSIGCFFYPYGSTQVVQGSFQIQSAPFEPAIGNPSSAYSLLQGSVEEESFVDVNGEISDRIEYTGTFTMQLVPARVINTNPPCLPLPCRY
jgi:hypothetical protein